MYRFLDRATDQLDEPHRFLLAAMRTWVSAVRQGRCPCRTLLRGFVDCGVPEAVRDFGMAMAALDRDGIGTLAFAPLGATVTADEARVLALFDASLTGAPDRTRRIAATLVDEAAAPRLAMAVEWTAMRLAEAIFVEHDR